MAHSINFDTFLQNFFGLFTQKRFKGEDFITYLAKPDDERSGDEAPIVDTVIVSSLLELLGFEPGERVYNETHQSQRPDFAPFNEFYGACFVIEDKSTSLTLTLDLSNPESHVSQLSKYARSAALHYGWLTNGKKLLIYNYENPQAPVSIIDLNIVAAVQEWNATKPVTINESTRRKLRDLFDLFQKEAFSSTLRLEQELAIDLETWRRQALPLGQQAENETILVEALQTLISDLQHDARRQLEEHLRKHHEFKGKSSFLNDHNGKSAEEEIQRLRENCVHALQTSQNMLGLIDVEVQQIQEKFLLLEQDAKAYSSPKELSQEILLIINEARKRKYATVNSRAARPWTNLNDVVSLRDTLQKYNEVVFAWHQRQAMLRQEYRDSLAVYDDYMIWKSVVQETMLGGLNESQQQQEFALQAAYVVFIRLLLIRVCEDKGLFKHRFLSDGGISHWQEDMERYLVFANGNPYEPLLDMAYQNAQNIYAHFFTGRELFNWYTLDRRHLLQALHRLSRFNFAGVDSDIIGTVYSTYVGRAEKRDKGQYYTPAIIVKYILDRTGYMSGPSIIGADKRLIDPACGSGSFLVTAAKRLVLAYTDSKGQIDDPLTVLQRVQNSLFGFDLNPFACYLAEVNLLIQVLDLVKLAYDMGQRPHLQRFHIYNSDSLIRPAGMYYYTQFNTLLAAENDLANQIKQRQHGTEYEKGFAFVVANPPYGATLSDEYKQMLRSDWANVFYGHPDTYTFFLQLGIELLAEGGKLGYITPNTYLMGTNTATLRRNLLYAGKIEEIVDLPQGIWKDATIDCALIFLTADTDKNQRKTHQITIHLLATHDNLEKVSLQQWRKTLTQQQSSWIEHPNHEMQIRYDDLLQCIEKACLILINNDSSKKVLRLEDITESSQGIIPYKTKMQGETNLYIKPKTDIPKDEPGWKPLLDSNSYVGRYEMHWGPDKPYLKYGDWLWRTREIRFFDEPKLLVQAMRNRSLTRRLVATYDKNHFYNRHNYNNIIVSKNQPYDLKYILALFNSALLNYWYRSKFDNVNINPSYIRQLPIYPANRKQQAELIVLVDEILASKQELNDFRERGYVIGTDNKGNILIDIPYDILLHQLQESGSISQPYSLFDARAAGYFTIPEQCDLNEGISNVTIPTRYPTQLVLRHKKLWFEISEDNVRTFLEGYLRHPQWKGKRWDDLKSSVFIPSTNKDFETFFTEEFRQKTYITNLLDKARQVDEQIDEKVFELYGIADPGDREEVLTMAT